MTDEDEDKLWSIVTKDVQRLDKNHVLKKSAKNSAHKDTKLPSNTKKNIKSPKKISQSEPQKQPPSKGLDRKTKERLRKGTFTIEARLDLHGHSKTEAYEKLVNFLIASRHANKRWILVITGKGQKEANTGVIRQSMPEWLSSPALEDSVLGFNVAKPKDGGLGAFYVLLRKKTT
jgi:DNA-nicking Smr family endonuclease